MDRGLLRRDFLGIPAGRLFFQGMRVDADDKEEPYDLPFFTRGRIEKEKTRIAEQVKALEKSIPLRRAKLEEARKVQKPIFLKYGDPTDSSTWKVRVRDGVVWKPLEYRTSLSAVPKDDAFSALVKELYEVAATLEFFCEEDEENHTPHLDDWVKKHPDSRIVGLFPNNVQGYGLVAIIKESSRQDALSSRPSYALDRFFLEKKIGSTDARLTAEVKRIEDVVEIVDPALKSLVTGYPTIWPPMSLEPFEKGPSKATIVTGYHASWEDRLVIATPQTLLDAVLTLAHEAGHVVVPHAERRSKRKYDEEVARTKFFEEVLARYKPYLEAVEAYLKKPTKENYFKVARQVLPINRLAMLLGLYGKQKEESLVPEEQIYGLEEVSADLFQRLVLNELARTHPAGTLLLDYATLWRQGRPGPHAGAFAIAERLTKKHGPIDALRALMSACEHYDADRELAIQVESPTIYVEGEKAIRLGLGMEDLEAREDRARTRAKKLSKKESTALETRFLELLTKYGQYVTL